MKSSEISSLISQYIEEPDYVFYNFQQLTRAIEEAEEGITEGELRSALCKASEELIAPDVVAVVAMILPPLCYPVLCLKNKFVELIIQVLVWLDFAFCVRTVIWMIDGTTPFKTGALLVGSAMIFMSWYFRGETRKWNAIRLIFRIVEARGRLPKESGKNT